MSYIRFGERLPSGKISGAYIIGALKGLVNMNSRNFIPYEDLRELIETNSKNEFQRQISRRLNIHQEELRVFCQRVYKKFESGEIRVVADRSRLMWEFLQNTRMSILPYSHKLLID